MVRQLLAVVAALSLLGACESGEAATRERFSQGAPALLEVTLRNERATPLLIQGDYFTVETPDRHSRSIQVFNQRQIVPGQTLTATVVHAASGDSASFGWLLADPAATNFLPGGTAYHRMVLSEGTTRVEVTFSGERHRCVIDGVESDCTL